MVRKRDFGSIFLTEYIHLLKLAHQNFETIYVVFRSHYSCCYYVHSKYLNVSYSLTYHQEYLHKIYAGIYKIKELHMVNNNNAANVIQFRKKYLTNQHIIWNLQKKKKKRYSFMMRINL